MSSEVVARKLQGVYDCIDVRNFKGAIKLCQRKDIQHYDATKALMAYSMISMQRTEEGIAIAREIKDRGPADESLLKTLGHCFRLAHMDLEVAECYENALAQIPHSEELAVELFKAYARCGDPKKMQTVAMKLFKTHNDPKYVFWAVCSILQQDACSSTMLVLAERMLRRVLYETEVLHPPKRTAGAEEALLWANVLTRQAEVAKSPEERILKLNEALESLKDFGSHLDKSRESSIVAMHNHIDMDYRIDSDVQFKKDPSIVELHPFMGKMRQVHIVKLILSSCFSTDAVIENHGSRADYLAKLLNLFEDILFNYPDQWDVHQMWIEQIIADGSPDVVVTHRNRLLNMQQVYSRLRGPFLAEKLLLLQAHRKDPSLISSWVPTAVTGETASLIDLPAQPVFYSEMARLICRYVSLFENKDCCFTDIKKYIDSALKESGADDICRSIVVNWIKRRREDICKTVWTAFPCKESLSRLNKLDQMLHYISASHTSKALLNDRLALHALVSSASAADSVGGLEDRGLKSGDNLLLVCSAWIQDALATLDAGVASATPVEVKHFFGNIVWAIVLKAGQLCSEYNYTFPLQSLQGPFRALALSEAGLKAYKTLDVKQIQIDSMTYLAIPPMLESGFFREALMGLRAVVMFHKGARQETGEMLCKACKMANYDKALEIKDFGVRCARSMQLGLAQSEFPLLDIADTKHNRADTLAYLKLNRAGFLVESATDVMMMTSEENDKYYHENMDYDVLPPSCSHQTQLSKGVDADMKRRAGYLRRLEVSRNVSTLMMKLMQLDPASEIIASVEALRLAAISNNSSKKSPPFSPASLSAYNCGPDGFEDSLWIAVCNVGAFVAECMRLATETPVLTDLYGIINFESVDTGRVALEMHMAAIASLRAVAAVLLPTVTLPHVDSSNDSPAPLSPSFIRMASAFCVTVGNLCPLMLESLTEPLVHSSSKVNLKPLVLGSGAGKAKKKGQKKSTDAIEDIPSGCQKVEAVIKEVISELATIMSDLLQALHNAKDSFNEDVLQRFIAGWRSTCENDESLQSGLCDINIIFNDTISLSRGGVAESNLNILLGRARAAIMTDIAVSQQASCTRLHETLLKKYSHFKIVFP